MILRYSLLAVAVVAVGGMAWVRLAPLTPEAWHVRPQEAQRTGKPNDFLSDPIPRAGQTAAQVMTRLHAVAMAEPRVRVLAGDPQQGFVTYVQRSALMGYPDMISVTAQDTDQGATLRLWSRSKFGHSDLGVNAARVTRWLDAL